MNTPTELSDEELAEVRAELAALPPINEYNTCQDCRDGFNGDCVEVIEDAYGNEVTCLGWDMETARYQGRRTTLL